MEIEPQASGCQPQQLHVTLNKLHLPILSAPLLITELGDEELLFALKSKRVGDRCGTDVALLLFLKNTYLCVQCICEHGMYGD